MRRTPTMNTPRLVPVSLALAACLALLTTMDALGGDAYVVRVAANAAPAPQASQGWNDGLRFHNTGTSAATVRLLDVSNGLTLTNPQPLTLQPGTTRVSPNDANWLPIEPTFSLAVEHFDVPPDIVVTSRLYFLRNFECTFPCGGPSLYGWVPLPVFHALIPAGTEQVLLDADLGDAIPSRINLALYNGGTVEGHAVVEIRSACDDAVLASTTVIVPPLSIVGRNAADALSMTCNPPTDAQGDFAGSAYVSILMDQPEFGFLAVLADNTTNYTPSVAISVPQNLN
jgi:hypothetical protein